MRTLFLLLHDGARGGGGGVECHMRVVVIFDSSGQFKAWSALRSVFSILGTSLYKGYPGLAPII